MKKFLVFLSAYACFAAGFMTALGVERAGLGRFAVYYVIGLGLSALVLLVLFQVMKSRKKKAIPRSE